MKTLELNINDIHSANELVDLLSMNNTTEGDTLKLFNAESKNDFILIGLLIIVAAALVYYFEKEKSKRQQEGEKILESLFAGKNADEIEKQIKDEYGIIIEIENASETEREFWNKIAITNLSKAYHPDEPDYSEITLLEPNPNYQPWKKAI